MSAEQVIFYLVSAMILVFGFLSVTTRKIFRAAIYLLFSLIGIAGFYFMIQYEFIAAVQIVVYVGGIVVLIIFAIFLTHKSGDDMPLPNYTRGLVAFLLVFLGFAFTYFIIKKETFTASSGENLPAAQAGMEASVTNIGTQMLDTQNYGFVLPFEIVSILLLAAMIGAIVIALKIKKE